MRRSRLNSLERCLLAAELETAFWSTTIENKPGNADFLTELVVLEEDVKSGRFPYGSGTCSANAGRVNA